MNAIEILHLTKRFGNLTAVNDLTLSIRKGEVFSLLGVNGAGKTTTLRMLCGIITPDEGSITVLGHTSGSPEAKSLRISSRSSRFSEEVNLRTFIPKSW